MRIIFDAMGGDNAPLQNILAAIDFAKVSKNTIILVGKEEIIKKILNENGGNLENIEIVDAKETIEMEDIPTKAIREKKDSSMVKGFNMLKESVGDVLVSAGNSGALLTGAIVLVGRIKKISRPALAGILPSNKGGFMLLDCGANTNCKVDNFVQFAMMGSIYLKRAMNIQNPKVGLLNIGVEENKGNDLYKEVYKYLKENGKDIGINFVGNIEARDVFESDIDLVLADGFTGNIFLKAIEGLGKYIKVNMKESIFSGFKKILALPLIPSFKVFYNKLDYRKFGGGLFLGVSKPIVKAHGSSDRLQFFYTLKQAEAFVEGKVVEQIKEDLNYANLEIKKND